MQPERLSVDSDEALGIWWTSLSPVRHAEVVDSVDHDDMARGHVYAELRTLRLIDHLMPTRSAGGAWRNPIQWPGELADEITRLAQR